MGVTASTLAHEAAHAAACLILGRRIEYVSVTPGLSFPGEEVGRCRAPVTGSIQVRDLGVALAGYWVEGAPGWPPAYEQARNERREALGVLIRVLDLSEEQYERAIDVTRNLLADPIFRRLQGAIARALAAVPMITGEDAAALAEAHGIPVKTKEQEHGAQAVSR